MQTLVFWHVLAPTSCMLSCSQVLLLSGGGGAAPPAVGGGHPDAEHVALLVSFSPSSQVARVEARQVVVKRGRRLRHSTQLAPAWHGTLTRGLTCQWLPVQAAQSKSAGDLHVLCISTATCPACATSSVSPGRSVTSKRSLGSAATSCTNASASTCPGLTGGAPRCSATSCMAVCMIVGTLRYSTRNT